MIKHLLAAAIAAALFASPAVPAFAQAAAAKADKAGAKKADTKAAKKLTPQQQKMKDCGPKWTAYKKEKNVKGRAEYRKFMSTCLKG